MSSIVLHIVQGVGVSIPMTLAATGIIKLLSMLQLWLIRRLDDRKKGPPTQAAIH